MQLPPTGRLSPRLLVVLSRVLYQKHLLQVDNAKKTLSPKSRARKPKNQENKRWGLGRTEKLLLHERWRLKARAHGPHTQAPGPSIIITNPPATWAPAQSLGPAEGGVGPQHRKQLPLTDRGEAAPWALGARAKDTQEARDPRTGRQAPPSRAAAHLDGAQPRPARPPAIMHTGATRTHPRHAHPPQGQNPHPPFVSSSAQKCQLSVSAPHPHSSTLPRLSHRGGRLTEPCRPR